MNNKNTCILTLCFSVIALSGCNDTPSVTELDLSANENGILVNPTWVKENHEQLVLIDVREERAFNGGHIEGAISLSWQDLSNMSVASTEPGWGQLNAAEQIQDLLQHKGVRQDQTAVVYTESLKSWGDETRVAWSLQSAGMEIKILDGGITAWENSGYALSQEAINYSVSDFAIDALDDSINITTDELVARINEVTILDTREASEHAGRKNYGEKYRGVIPNSIHTFFKDFYADNGKLKDADTITAMMTEKGINKDDEIVVYCTGGVRSTVAFYALQHAGFSNVRNYDGSFSDWTATEQPLG
ncbi:sulfurtransferase [Thaumasiovibrio sp. DFM-14]|uniref:sulfurtransferase n=1 Tax=Thaumasiovibrio sp. DFM-14 TaxID=3384792 RepID=UPI0039A392B5